MEVKQAKEQLAQIGVQVLCEVPLQAVPSSLVMVKPLFREPEAAARALLGEVAGASVVNLGSATVYKKGSITMSVDKGSILEYLDRSIGGGLGDTKDDTAVAAVKQFMSDKGLTVSTSNFHVSRQGELAIVNAEQTVGRMPLFGTCIYAEVLGGKVRRFKLQGLDVQGASGYRKALVPVSEALQRAGREIVRMEGKGEIVSIEQGYFTEIYDASQWEVVPAWRVKASSGLELILNGYTGELESAK